MSGKWDRRTLYIRVKDGKKRRWIAIGEIDRFGKVYIDMDKKELGQLVHWWSTRGRPTQE